MTMISGRSSTNSNASDKGLIGTEDDEIIVPALEEARKLGVFCFGPYPADGFFASDTYAKFDAVLAMYFALEMKVFPLPERQRRAIFILR